MHGWMELETSRRVSYESIVTKNISSTYLNHTRVWVFSRNKQAAETRKVARRSGLPIALSFVTQKPLGQLLRKPFQPPCPSNCNCSNRSLCLKKNIAYNVSCNLCEDNDNYAGETGRTFNRRMYEHSRDPKSNVYQHFRQIHPNTDILSNITTGVMTSGFEDTNHRVTYESNFIRKHNPPINIQLARR